jgi:predicted phosphodiesterase
VRLAILADIHGNVHALEAVLADLIPWQPDEIIINGDMVNRAPHSVAVMERLAALGTTQLVTLVLGNHDDLMRKWVERAEDLPGDWFADPFWAGTAWQVDKLAQAGWIDTLGALPMTHRIAVPDAPSLLISHGSPRHYREGYTVRMEDATLSEILQMHPADVLIGSHTHVPMERRWGHHRVLNTGAVGTPFNRDTRAQYLRLTLSDQVDMSGQVDKGVNTPRSWQVDFRAVDYDHAAAIQAYEDTGYAAEGGLSAHIFLQELRYARPHYGSFWMWCETEQRVKDWHSWQDFVASFPERFEAPAVPSEQPIARLERD